MSPVKYRTNTVDVDAIQYTGHNDDDLTTFTRGRCVPTPTGMLLRSLEGVLHVAPNMWIARGPSGAFHLFSNPAFHALCGPPETDPT